MRTTSTVALEQPNHYRVFLHELVRRSRVPGVKRADLMAYVANRGQCVPAQRVDVVKRLVSFVPVKTIADVVQRQAEYQMERDRTNKPREGVATGATCITCDNRFHFKSALKTDDGWLCARCADEATKP